MRRFVIGLVVGLIGVWLIVRWRLKEGQHATPLASDAGSGRIALPDRPWTDDTSEDVPEVEPVVTSESRAEADSATDAVEWARHVIESTDQLTAYCARCRTKREMANVRATATKDGRAAVRGTCPVCGANMFRFV
jgi:hypothetical protein